MESVTTKVCPTGTVHTCLFNKGLFSVLPQPQPAIQPLQHGATIGHGSSANPLVGLQQQIYQQPSQSMVQLATGVEGAVPGAMCLDLVSKIPLPFANSALDLKTRRTQDVFCFWKIARI